MANDKTLKQRLKSGKLFLVAEITDIPTQEKMFELMSKEKEPPVIEMAHIVHSGNKIHVMIVTSKAAEWLIENSEKIDPFRLFHGRNNDGPWTEQRLKKPN